MKLSRQIEVLFQAGTAGGQSDGQLLDRFVQTRDEAAFAALVDRHGAMVLRVCRHVLVDEHHAQDASQATFLVLARSAGAIHGRESVAAWLHGVALRVAAKARVAAARRRARERRAGEIAAARQAVDSSVAGVPDHERWQWLHDELGRLPESFRSPLVLCYLEGLTQEQAAVQLRCPLGTVQSRLARGRAKLKSRLEKQDMNLSAVLAGVGLTVHQAAAAPDAWAEATVRLALRFAGSGPIAAAAGEPAITLAQAVLRTMAFAKLKIAVGLFLIAAFMMTGAAVWASREPRSGRVPPVVKTENPREEPQPAPAKTPESERNVKRVVRGIVRDVQGRPVAKAWVGSEVVPMLDVWTLITDVDRLRVTQTPFRDAQGQVVPAGPLGSYFDYRNDEGHLQPLDPADVRRVNPSRLPPLMSRKDSETVKKRARKDLPGSSRGQGQTADDPARFRLDHSGSHRRRGPFRGRRHVFASPVSAGLSPFRLARLSPGASRAFVDVNDPDHAIDITLKPTRLVRARFIETPADNGIRRLEWNVYTALPPPGKPGGVDAPDGWGAWWGRASAFSTEPDSSRHLELNLPGGRYKVLFRSSTIERTISLEVPAGEGPVDLPGIRLESLAWYKMLGRVAAEIDAVDRDGKPVKLADYRGKVVLLTFIEGSTGEPKEIPAQIIALLKPLQQQPLAILAIHDASITSLEEFRNKQAPGIERRFAPGKVPCRPLLDRLPPDEGAGPNGLRAGDIGSGRTAAAYELVAPACFIIDKNGRLVFALVKGEGKTESFRLAPLENRNVPPAYLVEHSSDASEGEADDEKRQIDFAAGEIDRALREQLGLPHAPDPDDFDLPIKPFEGFFWKPIVPKEGLVIRGKVVGADGKGVTGALVSPILNQVREKEVKTLPSGEFSFTIDEAHSDLGVRVEAPGLATKAFWMLFSRNGTEKEPEGKTGSFVEPDGRISKPLRTGLGAVVTGRVVRDGKPVSGVTMVVQHPATIVVREGGSTPVRPLQNRETKTDDRGQFRIPFVSSELECSIFAQPDSLADHQTVIPRSFQSGRDGGNIDLGEVEVRPGRKLAGRVILADGKAPPLKAKLVVWPEHGGELTGDLDATGRFEVNGVPDGRLVVYLTQKIGIGIVSALPGYRLSARNKCLDPTFPDRLQGMIKADITNLTIGLDSGDAPEAASIIPFGIDPARVADFEEAKTGPITGISPP